MKPQLPLLLFLPFICCSLASEKKHRYLKNPLPGKVPAKIVEIELPDGFERINEDKHSFTAFLQNIALKKDKTVYLFNGKPKGNQEAQFAVLDIPVGNKDLQQCADAVMRLRATYLFEEKRFEEIIFTDNNLKPYVFEQPHTKAHLEKYLDQVYSACGTASLSKQLKPVKVFDELKPGDVLIKGGFPGHAVMVMDMAINKEGKKIYLLAQSYMPAQDIHILINPGNTGLSPWYEVNTETSIETPEWTFNTAQLKRW
jgi:Domain of unknown function (4846)